MPAEQESPPPRPAFDLFARVAASIGVVLASSGLIACQIRTGGVNEASISSLLFLLWPYAPYVAALGILVRSNPTPLRSLSMVGVGLFGMVVYLQTASSERLGSTAALLYLWMPIWQFVALAAALGITEIVGQRKRRVG
jgi:hypothetical protein